jgi:hypothetical protein
MLNSAVYSVPNKMERTGQGRKHSMKYHKIFLVTLKKNSEKLAHG